jgi:Zn ribbon nucleic-acid-binding protein
MGGKKPMQQMSHSLQVKSADKEAAGSYRLEYYSPKEARKKGFKMFWVTLAASIFSIVLPGVHFVSVPLGILASPLVGVYFYKTRKGAAKSMTADFVCPECQAKNHIAASSITHYYASQCAECGQDLRLTPLPSA